jgi:two-component system cell cycle sensor histidine kinase/response regulator CckA
MMEAARRAPSVLIVEDEALVAQDLRQTLAEQGFDAFAVASSAEEAIATAADKRPDVVLMDIRINGPTDGIAAARALRERFGMPVIFLTAHADARTLASAKGSDPSGYLLKPVKSSELKISIELALHRHNSQVRLERSAEDERLTHDRLDSVERLASLVRMAAGVAHQINNPLTVVLANAELVADELERRRAGLAAPNQTVSDQQRLDETIECQAELRLAAQRIARIVANIQFFSQPAPPPSSRADVHRAIERALRVTASDLAGRARVIQELRPVPRVRTSEAHLTEVMKQLLLNAAYAMEDRPAPSNEINLRTSLTEDGQVRIEVADTGCGMPPEVQRRMFEPFFTTKPVGVGTGLGLSICHGIVTAAGGRLSVQSRAAGGSQISVLLPSVESASGLMPTPPQLRPDRPRLRLPLRRPTREQRRILVVDDEPLLLRSVRRLLPEYELVCVESARKALALLDSGRPFDLIVSDVMMPEMSGIDFYEVLCARYPEDARRVVFVTGGALGKHVGSFLGSVPNVRLEKPFAAADLRRAIEQALV